MSYEEGMAALRLEMPSRIPRTEYSAEAHWDLIKAVTGIPVSVDADPDTQAKASRAFVEAWNFDFFWGTLVSAGYMTGRHTAMGHAEYAAGGVDFSAEVGCPFKSPEEALAFDPMEEYGACDIPLLTREFEENHQKRLALRPTGVSTTGIYITLVSGLIDIFGWDMMLMAAGTDPDAFGELTNRYAAWIGDYYKALAAADVPVVMAHDDIVWTSGPFIHPDWYRKFIFPNYKKFFGPLIDSGKILVYTSDGNIDEFVDDIAACGVNGFCIEPTTDMAAMAEKYGKTHAIIGNADTRILLGGTRPEIRAEVERCIGIGKDCPGYFMCVGNHIPHNTPVENAIYYNECYEELCRR